MIRIRSKRDGFRRCGLAHAAGPVDYPDGRFTEAELAALRAEPMLVVETVEDGGEGEPPCIPPSTGGGRTPSAPTKPGGKRTPTPPSIPPSTGGGRTGRSTPTPPDPNPLPRGERGHS